MGANTSFSSSSSSSALKNKFAFINDNFTSLSQVTDALRREGLESSNLILGIDFTRSNEWTGKVSFNNQSLHAIGYTPNPYEKAISIVGKTLAPFDEDNLIPCFGFGDDSTGDNRVFSFHSDHSPCHGFEEVLSCYKILAPRYIDTGILHGNPIWEEYYRQGNGPTSYAPVIEAAVDIVEKSNGQYHILVIIADGQVTRGSQEKATIRAITEASSHPLSIILVGVGDGPWHDMRRFDDEIPSREFDNFQFVNFTEIMSKRISSSEREAAFALAALMEIPLQYKATLELGLLGCVTGKAKKIVPCPPPVPNFPNSEPSETSGVHK